MNTICILKGNDDSDDSDDSDEFEDFFQTEGN